MTTMLPGRGRAGLAPEGGGGRVGAQELAGGHDLGHDLAGREVAHDARSAAGAEGAPEGAPDLRGDALGDAVFGRDEHGLDALAVLAGEQQFSHAVRRVLNVDGLKRGQRETFSEAVAQPGGQGGDFLPRLGEILIERGDDLVGAEGGQAEFFAEGLPLGRQEAPGGCFQGRHADHSGALIPWRGFSIGSFPRGPSGAL